RNYCLGPPQSVAEAARGVRNPLSGRIPLGGRSKRDQGWGERETTSEGRSPFPHVLSLEGRGGFPCPCCWWKEGHRERLFPTFASSERGGARGGGAAARGLAPSRRPARRGRPRRGRRRGRAAHP